MKMKASKPSSEIRTVQDLRNEISKVKTDLRLQEDQLHKSIARIPRETIKAVSVTAFPFLVNSAIAAKAFSIAKNFAGIIFHSVKQKNTLKKNMFNAAKEIGFATAIKAILALVRKNKDTSQAKDQQSV
jgi:hypothetical protein